MSDANGGAPAKWADLGMRTASSLVLVPVVLLDVWMGGAWFIVLIALMGVLAAREWVAIAHGGHEIQFAFLALAALASSVLPTTTGTVTALIGLILVAAVSNIVEMLRNPKPSTWSRIGALYVGLPVLSLATLREDATYGAQAIIWLLLAIWSADIMAYFAGRIIGGPKLAPILSPKKTWAGLAGAVAGAALITIIFGTFMPAGIAWPLVAIAGVLGIVEQGGDILESALKRHHGLKDSGNLIPGHGGIIDRVDGLFAAAVGAWLFGILRNPQSPAAGLLVW
jgi:phosphatidate cytidylyltransferase